MIAHWLRDRRRRKILERPFPAAWEPFLEASFARRPWLDASERARLRELVQVFIAEKRWEGAGGLAIDDEMRVTIAADANLLVLALPHDLYRTVETIIVYPSTVVRPEREPGFWEVPTEPVHGGMPILGEAHQRGPVILTWDAVRHGARHPGRGYNVVFHEFAHKLDMLDGAADGTPPLDSRADLARWATAFEEAYLRLRADTRRGRRTLLDPYGATDEAEFFAVATEAFFDTPVALRHEEPDLYAVLTRFYRQDPAARLAPDEG